MIDEPNCHKRGCIHFIGVKYDNEENEEGERVYCKAFPDGIPKEISYGEDEHLSVHPLQGNRIIFESS